VDLHRRRGPAGDVARTVKVADLRDDIRREQDGHLASDAPPYRWALRHIGILASSG
jgi:hypothetical protein